MLVLVLVLVLVVVLVVVHVPALFLLSIPRLSNTGDTVGSIGLSLVRWWASPQSYDDNQVLARKREQGCIHNNIPKIYYLQPKSGAQGPPLPTQQRGFSAVPQASSCTTPYICLFAIMLFETTVATSILLLDSGNCTLYRTSCNSNTTSDPFDFVSSQILTKIRIVPLFVFLTRGDRTDCSVCVFSSHPFWTSSSLDVPAGVTQEEGHTGFLIHLPSAVRALIFVARRIQPFLSLVDREVEFCVLTN